MSVFAKFWEKKFAAAAKVRVKDYTQSGSVASGTAERVVINPPAGKLWILLAIRMWTDADADATSGNHHMGILGQTEQPRYCSYGSDYATRVLIDANTIRDANSETLPPNEASLTNMLNNIILTPDEGITLKYDNSTDAAQENDRIWKLRVLEIPLERAV